MIPDCICTLVCCHSCLSLSVTSQSVHCRALIFIANACPVYSCATYVSVPWCALNPLLCFAQLLKQQAVAMHGQDGPVGLGELVTPASDLHDWPWWRQRCTLLALSILQVSTTFYRFIVSDDIHQNETVRQYKPSHIIYHTNITHTKSFSSHTSTLCRPILHH